MKKVLVFSMILFLFGCSERSSELDRGIAFREKLLNCAGCSFTAEITADFGDKTYTFVMDSQGNPDGSLGFTVREPESISGISGTLSAKGGEITFDEDRGVAFPLLAEGEITPVSGPWMLYNTLRSGYILSCGMEGDLTRLTLNDSYEEEAFQVDVWLNGEDQPVTAEILWKGRRVLTIRVAQFQFL